MPSQLWLFATTLLIVLLLPGPDMLLVLDSSGRFGRSRGFATAAGLAIARSTHVTLAALGLAALVRAWPVAFTAIRWAGAAYIVWLGVQLLRSRGSTAHGGAHAAAGSHAVFVRRAVLTNLLNPKALIFCSVLLPQFVNPHGWPAWQQLGVLGATSVLIGLGYDLLLATGGERLGRVLRAGGLAQRLQRYVFGSLLIAFGVRLAVVRT
ncbi:MAG: LysE family translocator [Caulobacterales bacterium]|nr:LysE family translocator [Caulobacterales bacterium]